MAESSQLMVQVVGGVTVVSFDTNNILDAIQIQRMGEELYRLVDEQDRRQVVLDFGKVKMLSSQAIGMLLNLRKKSQAIKGQVLLCGIRPDLHKVFKITQIDKLFKFFDGEKEALASLGVHGAS
ncbi:MAG: STAS domain-containing protein [Phycisphaerae bacterium]|nr:STAS domain-containing protein [Phycisphaerae bacterium]